MTHPLIAQLDEKIRLLLTESASLRLEIEELQAENQRLQGQLAQWEQATEQLLGRFDNQAKLDVADPSQ